MLETLSHLPTGQLVYLGGVVVALVVFAVSLCFTHINSNLPDRRGRSS